MSRDIKVVDAKRGEGAAPPRVTPPTIPDVDERSPAQLLWTLFQARVLISVITVAFVVLGTLYIFLATPIYRCDVVVQVEENQRTLAGLSELSSILSDRQPAETEMEILRSRALIGSVVDQLNLQIVSSPKRFPVLGSIGRRYRGSAPRKPLFGLSSYAWGGEQLRVQRLDLPDEYLNETLTLVAGNAGTYELRGPDREVLAKGEVGKAASGKAGVFVSDLVARPGTRFHVMKRGRLRVIEDLQQRLRVSEKGRKTGVLQVALEGPDPVLSANILDAVAASYVRQNVERKSAEAAKTLDFLESQLPNLKANLDAAEAQLRGYQVQKGTLDLSREAQSMLERSVAIERTLTESELQASDLRQRFTENHPALLAIKEKIEKMRGERGALNAKMRELPGTELESARLQRDVKVASELYNVLMNKAQELRVVKSGTIGNVRVIDRASVPDKPDKPVIPLVLVGSMVLGLGAGIVTAFTRKSLYAGLDDPETVEHVTGMTVYATVPRSPKEASNMRGVGKTRAHPLLASIDPADPAVEALRSLRTGLQFALLEAKNNVVVVSGPTAEVGKSFVTVNLAHVMATAGRKVLVVDADLRRGRVHRFFSAERQPGLSDVLTGSALLSDAVRKTQVESLHYLPTGNIPPNPAELLASERFERVLSELSGRYDLVLIDTAPILPVTDAALIAPLAGTTLLVLRAGAHPAREILLAVKRLAHSGVRVQGAIFNDVSGAGARYSKYAYQYRYDSRA